MADHEIVEEVVQPPRRSKRPRTLQRQGSLREILSPEPPSEISISNSQPLPSSYDFTSDLTIQEEEGNETISSNSSESDLSSDLPSTQISQQPARSTYIIKDTFSDDDVRDIIKFLRDKKRGSFKTLLRTIAQYPERHHGCVRSLEETILYNENKLLTPKRIVKMLDERDWKPVKTLLKRQARRFGAQVVGQFDVRPDNQTDGENNSAQLLINRITTPDLAELHAPRLFDVLQCIIQPVRSDSGRETPRFKIISLMANIAYMMMPRKYNGLSAALGMFLHHNNLTRRGIEILAAMGLIPSYDTINEQVIALAEKHRQDVKSLGRSKKRVIVYDNFNVTDNVRETRAGDEKVLHNITTGLIKIGSSIPRGGLKRSWFSPSYQLSIRDIIPLDTQSIQKRQSVDKKLWCYYISRAIATQFPSFKERYIELNPSNKQQRGTMRSTTQPTFIFELPTIERPETHTSTTAVPLGPLFYDESTNEGTKAIFDHIYEEQLKVDDSDVQWEKNIFLMYGDALTTQRQHTWIADSSVSDHHFGQGKWLIPVFGLWHLRYNYLQLLYDEHWGSAADDFSCLRQSWHSVYTNRHFDRKLFQQLSDLIIQSFQSRLIALVIRFFVEVIKCLEPSDYAPDRISFDKMLLAQDKRILDEMMAWIITELNIDQNTELERQQQDDEWTNHLNFMHNVFPYLLLTDAIKYADIGLLRYAIRDTLLIFSASTDRWLYRRELAYYFWLTQTKAADIRLQKAILRESLYNRQGKPDSYYEMDRANELLNLHLRIVKTTRRTSSLTVEKLLERYARTANYMTQLNDAFTDMMSVTVNNEHRKKRVIDHLWILAGNLWGKDSQHNFSIRKQAGRGSLTVTRHLFREGQIMLDDTVYRFNQWRRLCTFTEGDVNDDDYTLLAERVTHQLQIVQAYREHLLAVENTSYTSSENINSSLQREPQTTTQALNETISSLHTSQAEDELQPLSLVIDDQRSLDNIESQTAEYRIGYPLLEHEDSGFFEE